MKTNNIKSFAKKTRIILMDGVSSQLKYWGFNSDGSCTQELLPTSGGYSFRQKVFNDPTVPAKWNKLKNRLKNKQAVEDVIEEAAYTWFNRLMAIKILEVNGYLPEQLAYANGTLTPAIVQNAKRGQHTLTQKAEINLLNEYLRENREEQAFSLLLVQFCNDNKLLHDVFGRIDDYTEILLPQNLLQTDGLMDLINSGLIAEEDYKEVELIGWLYQFYISDKKDKVFADFKKNKKARAEDIPAATQIFTPKWIVKYMVENTVGKIYLDYEPASGIRAEMKYLVENTPGTKRDAELVEASGSKKPLNLFSEQPTPGTEPAEVSLISDITQLTLLDPASGSGHILVTGFDLLFMMYREAGYSSRQAVESILLNNLFGLEIDDRAMQLARFAVLLKAAQYDAGILNRDIIPHVYSFPEADHFSTEELHIFLGHEGLAYTAELKDALNLMNQGKNIGSALKLSLSDACKSHILKSYNEWVGKEKTASLDIVAQGIWYRLKPFIDVLLVMTSQYAAVVANPPYMGHKNMNEDLKKYINSYYPITKSDLCTVFIEVLPEYLIRKGKYGIIVPPSWMFLSSFESLRNDIIKNKSIDSLLHLSRGVFGADFGSCCFVISNEVNKGQNGVYFRLVERTFQEFYQGHLEELFLLSKQYPGFKYRFKDYRKGDPKLVHSNDGLRLYYPNIPQSNFSKIPGSPIAYWVSDQIRHVFNYKVLSNYVPVKKGIDTGNNGLFVRCWHEISQQKFSLFSSDRKWFVYIKGGTLKKWWGNLDLVVNWENGGREISNYSGSTIRNRDFIKKQALTWSLTSSNGFGARFVPENCVFDNNGSSVFPKENVEFILGYLNSVVAGKILSVLNPTLAFQVGDIARLPINWDLNFPHSQIVSSNISVSRKENNDHETSWGFQQSPLFNNPNSLKQAFAQWLGEAKNDFFQLHANEEELNQIFIEIYDLQDELAPKVALKDITILQDELNNSELERLEPVFRKHGKDAIELPIKKEEVLSQFISYCVGVMMGRYRLDKPGLNIAHPKPSDEELAAYRQNGQTIVIDEDAILPLMGEDCSFPDDVLLQLKHLLLAIWGEDTLTDNINFLQECLGMNLHKWLTEKFWGYHTGMYKKKPIYWLFTSNPKQPHKAAFRVLAYMHRMDRFTVQQIQRKYLYPHQEYIKREIAKLKENEGNLGRQELKRLEMLHGWEVECRNYNEVLKELANLQIEFDLDDGVSVNYEKFKGAVAEI